MRLLLDTHALLWWMGGDTSLDVAARGLIEDPANDVSVSIASLWEIAIKVQAGKLESDMDEILGAMATQGIRVLDVRPAHLGVLVRLRRHHKDPFDHMIVAQAIAEGATVMSEDRLMALYPAVLVRCSGGPAGVH